MAASPENQVGSDGPVDERRDIMQVSAYDRVSSTIVSLLLLLGLVVGIMFLLFLTMRIVSAPRAVRLEIMEDLEPAAASLSTGGGEEFEEPGLEELEPTPEPQLSDMVEAVTDAVTTQPAALEALTGDAEVAGHGSGDGRKAGPGGTGGADIIPFGRRTKILYGETSIDEYATLLDYFGIELAAAGGGQSTVDYAAKLAQATPEKRSGAPEQENRVYLIWRRGSRLADFDRSLLAKAGVDTADRQIMQFLPTPIEQRLRRLEKEELGTREERELRLTVYGIVENDGRYDFEVKDQLYRK